jgi:hypothetical protein
VYGNSEMVRGDEIVPRIAWKLIYGLPESSLRQHRVHGYRRKRFHDHLAVRLGPNFLLVEPGRIPPVELVLETNVCDEEEVRRKGRQTSMSRARIWGSSTFSASSSGAA